MCNQNLGCDYWTWRPWKAKAKANCTLYSASANTDLQSVQDAFSGKRDCFAYTGNDSEPYQHFFSTFSDKVKQDPLETCPQSYAFYSYS